VKSASETAALRVPPPRPRLHEVQGQRPSRLGGWLANRAMDALCALPASTRHALARGLGRLIYTLGIRRRVALDNLAHAFPDKSEAERRAIAREAYVTMAHVVMESIDPRDPWTRLLPPEGESAVAWKALQEYLASGRGALLVTAHFGNWERLGKGLSFEGVKLNALVRPLKGALNMRIVDNRIAAGVGLVYPKGAIAQAQEALARGESMYMLLDQSLPAKAAVFVPFFHRPAATTPALAVAARRTGAPVFVVMGVRDEQRRRLRLEVEGPIPAPEGLDEPATLQAHTAAVVASLERHIRRHPGQWLWLHRRWKVQPLAEAAEPSRG
jgi:Kdo2-lipid IVA lauroyltransferase/acyltransferase